AWIERLSRWRRQLPAAGEGMLARAQPQGTPGRGALRALTARQPPEVTLTRLLDPDVRHALVRPGLLGSAHRLREPEDWRWQMIRDRPTALDRVTALDAQVYMCDDILVKVDRASMLSSLEVRAPLLDHRLVDFAFRDLPPRLRLVKGVRKRLLRALARRWLQPGFDVARKQGFAIPIGRWLQGPWAPMVAELETHGSPLYDAGAVRQFLARARGNDRAANRIFQLLMLEAWRRHYRVDPPVEAGASRGQEA
ncbi:MAG: asparagine synthase-related protein, partial [Sphingomonadaceae bacterium]